MILGAERWLILGASGWFGRTLALIARDRATVLGISGSAPGYLRWNQEVIESFEPTHVFNCAFLTKEKLGIFGLDEYTSINESLIQQFRIAGSLASCRFAMIVSSGSVNSDPNHPYSLLKMAEENVCRQIVKHDRGSVILRAYSVSGPFMQRIQDYAFGDLLRQSLNTKAGIAIRAHGEVWRRYVDAEDSLRVAIGIGRLGECRLVETGGELVELGELAERIARLTGSRLGPRRIDPDASSIYASDNQSWTRACESLSFTPLPLEQQIEKTLAGCALLPDGINRYRPKSRPR